MCRRRSQEKHAHLNHVGNHLVKSCQKPFFQLRIGFEFTQYLWSANRFEGFPGAQQAEVAMVAIGCAVPVIPPWAVLFEPQAAHHEQLLATQWNQYERHHEHWSQQLAAGIEARAELPADQGPTTPVDLPSAGGPRTQTPMEIRALHRGRPSAARRSSRTPRPRRMTTSSTRSWS